MSQLLFDSSQLEIGAREFGLTLLSDQIDKLIIFCQLLSETNKTLNLTRIPEEDYISLHLLDSLAIASTLDLNKISTLLDLGTGAGLPGIPLAIAFPNIMITLVDSTAKKLRFIDTVINRLNLSNAVTVHARAEKLGKDLNFKGKFDLVTARAVASLNKLLPLMLPLLNKNGIALCYKGPGIGAELDEVSGYLSKNNLEVSVRKEFALSIPSKAEERTTRVLLGVK